MTLGMRALRFWAATVEVGVQGQSRTTCMSDVQIKIHNIDKAAVVASLSLITLLGLSYLDKLIDYCIDT